MPISRARRMNLIAMAVLLTGLISLIAFHGMVFADRRPDGEVTYGWQVWPEIWQFITDLDFSDIADLIAASAFLTSVLLIVVAPFAIPVFRASRLAWWLAAIVSGTALTGLTGILVVDYTKEPADAEELGPAFFCLIASQVLNFVGLLFIRREHSPEQMVASSP